MRFVNLTPHAINIMGDISVTVGPSGQSLRIATSMEPVGNHDGVTLYRAKYGAVELVDNDTKAVDPNGLPAVQDGVMYIVSGLVLDALKDRPDVAAPGELVRDDKGQPVGCKGLKVN